MSAERQHRSSPMAAWILSVLVGFILYVLSFGPVAGLHGNGTIPDSMEPWIIRFYTPVRLVSQNAFTGPWYGSYVNWWFELLRKR